MELTTGQSAVRGLRSEGKLGLRQAKDAWFRRLMTFGGVSVILAISAIFFYLASVVVPLMRSAQLEDLNQYPLPGPQQERTLHLSSEELAEVGARVTDAGRVVFFDMRNGRPMAEHQARIPAGAAITAFDAGAPHQYATAFGLADGRVLLLKQTYEVTFPDDKRTITPGIEYPLGEEPTVVDEQRAPIRMLSVQHSGEGTTIVALTEDRRILVRGIATSKNLITGEVQLESSGGEVPGVEGEISRLMLEVKQRDLYVLHAGRYISHFDLSDRENPKLVRRAEVLPEGERVSALRILSGGYSLIVGSARGALAQWFLVRDADTGYRLERIREFDPLPGAITVIAPEYFRKGFLAGDERGNVGLYYATSHRTLLQERIAQSPIASATISPRANALMVQDAGGAFRHARIWNEHPEVSWHSLWQKVWYEGYDEPDYIWQSAAATSDFEPKFSLAPLTFGTLKAAFYAMLVAVPLAVLGAIFTAYFMSPRMRTVVKPSIEIMEALPTVILGFLAGLWLAPFVESNLAGTLLTVLFIPLFILVAAYAWHRLPQGVKQRVPAGWEAALLIPVVMLAVYAAIALGHPVEAAFFGGDMPYWMSNTAGITFEQRNSLVVGIAMGFAVTPNIFSIAEDAIFSVPRHLSSGSLALGATPWQTLLYVVLLTASPGIFSAIMIGMGRAVGETMIVLMATGNTAVMDFSIFTGFRTLSANIGVEMPETAVDSTHYRILFLSALVLFGFTFFVNTLAELVRQRLRERYSAM
jgi:phosphate transport system permease protein